MSCFPPDESPPREHRRKHPEAPQRRRRKAWSNVVTIPFTDDAHFFVRANEAGTKMRAGMRVGGVVAAVTLDRHSMEAKLRGLAMKLAGEFVDKLIRSLLTRDE